MSLNQFIGILSARWRPIAAILALFALGGLIAAFTMPTRYEGRSRLMLDILKPDPVTGTVIATQFLRAYTRTQIELISDYRTTGRVVDQLGWASDPDRIAAYEASGASGTEDLRHWLASQVAANTEASLVETSNILEIRYKGPSPAEAQKIAGLLRSSFVEESVDFRRVSAQRTADWYRQQAREALARLNRSEADRAAFAKANDVVVSAGNVDLEAARLQTLSATAVAAATGGGVIVNSGANPMQLQLDTLDQRIAQAATNLGPNHPALQAMRQEREALARNVGSGAGRVSGGPNVGAIQRQFEAEKSRVINKRGVMDRLSQMQNDVDLQRGQYQKTAQRVADLELEAQAADAGMSPMGGATTSDTPVAPDRLMIIAGSVAAGLGIGLLVALLLELFQRRVRSDTDLEQTGVSPVFAVIGQPAASNGALTRLLAHLDRRRTDDGHELETRA